MTPEEQVVHGRSSGSGAEQDPDAEAVEAGLPATLAFWTLLPAIDDPEYRRAWVDAAVPLLLDDRAIDASYAEQTAAVVEAAVGLPQMASRSCRLLFLVHPALGASVWELIALTPETGGTERALTGADAPAPYGGQTATFRWNAVDGLQTVRLDPADGVDAPADAGPDAPSVPPAGPPVVATASITVTREVAGLPCTLLAQASSTDLDAVAMATTPMQYLLTTDLLEELAEELVGSGDTQDDRLNSRRSDPVHVGHQPRG